MVLEAAFDSGASAHFFPAGAKKKATLWAKAFSTCVDEIRRQPLGLKALSHISNG
jgi:hypothetical protein